MIDLPACHLVRFGGLAAHSWCSTRPRAKVGANPAAGTPQIGSVINHFAVNQSSDVAPCRAEDGAFSSRGRISKDAPGNGEMLVQLQPTAIGNLNAEEMRPIGQHRLTKPCWMMASGACNPRLRWRDVLLSGETQSGDPGAGTATRSGQPSVSRMGLVSTQAVSVDRDIASEYLVRLQAWVYRCGGELGYHTGLV